MKLERQPLEVFHAGVKWRTGRKVLLSLDSQRDDHFEPSGEAVCAE